VGNRKIRIQPDRDARTPRGLLRAADEALYRAKALGRVASPRSDAGATTRRAGFW